MLQFFFYYIFFCTSLKRKESNFLLVSAFNLRVFVLGLSFVFNGGQPEQKRKLEFLIYDCCQMTSRLNYVVSSDFFFDFIVNFIEERKHMLSLCCHLGILKLSDIWFNKLFHRYFGEDFHQKTIYFVHFTDTGFYILLY